MNDWIESFHLWQMHSGRCDAEDARLYLSLHQCALTARHLSSFQSPSQTYLPRIIRIRNIMVISQKISMTTDLFWWFFQHMEMFSIFLRSGNPSWKSEISKARFFHGFFQRCLLGHKKSQYWTRRISVGPSDRVIEYDEFFEKSNGTSRSGTLKSTSFLLKRPQWIICRRIQGFLILETCPFA